MAMNATQDRINSKNNATTKGSMTSTAAKYDRCPRVMTAINESANFLLKAQK